MISVHGALGPIPGQRAAGARGHRGGVAHARRGHAGRGRVRSRGRGRLRVFDPAAVPIPGQRLSPARLDLDRLPGDPLPGANHRRPRPAAGHPGARRGAPRDRPAHRDHRLRQVDDARRDDRPHQRVAARAHHHARGSDRVPPRRQALDHQPARGRLRHQGLRAGDAPGAAAGPRRDPDRRDARRGDGADRAQRRRDRAPRALHAPYPRRHRDDQPDHRLLPARICSSRPA